MRIVMRDELREEIKKLTDKEKMEMIEHLFDQVEYLRDANNQKYELLMAMVESSGSNNRVTH